jgi:hypothetical protein
LTEERRSAATTAVLSVATLTFRYSIQGLEGFVPLLREAAREVDVQLS